MIRQLLQVEKPRLSQEWLEYLLSVLEHEHEVIAKAINYQVLRTQANLPVYANNAAALAAGLKVGEYYRTGADPDPVCVVH